MGGDAKRTWITATRAPSGAFAALLAALVACGCGGEPASPPCVGDDARVSACLVDDRLAVFAAPHGSDLAPGTRDDPVRTLHRAVELAGQLGRARVVACVGTYDDRGEPIEIEAPMDVQGGFDCAAGWAPPVAGAQSRVEPAATFPGEYPAVRVGAVAGTVRLTGIGLRAVSGQSPGSSSTGVLAVASPALALVLEGCEIVAGAGAPGAAGAPGGDGAAGRDATSDATMAPQAECPLSKGGDGGTGAASEGSVGEDGSPGITCPPGVDCAGHGTGGPHGVEFSTDGVAGAGGDGMFALPGGKGAKAKPLGSLGPAGYLPSRGERGADGAPGQGGGGGGGCYGFPGLVYPTQSGGAGGNGGCGGQGGEGGESGGGSFGVLLAAGASLSIRDTRIVTATGGAGASGGLGGAGGPGGLGWIWPTPTENDSVNCAPPCPCPPACTARGGMGGDGGEGGDGGAGGPGVEGPAAGIAHGSGATVQVDESVVFEKVAGVDVLVIP